MYLTLYAKQKAQNAKMALKNKRRKSYEQFD